MNRLHVHIKILNFVFICAYITQIYLSWRFAQIDAKKEETARLKEKPLEINDWDKNPEDMENGHDPMSSTGMRKR